MKKYCLFLICLITFSCASKKPELEKKLFKKVLLDIFTLETSESYTGDPQKPIKTKNVKTLGKEYHVILKHHGVSAEAFESTFQWYSDNPLMLDSLFQEMINHVDDLKAKSSKNKDLNSSVTTKDVDTNEVRK